MAQKTEFKPKAGYVYECMKPVRAKGLFRGKMVKAVKIGNVKDFTNRLASLITAVYENFDFHFGIKTDDVVGLEGIIHTALQDYRIFTRDGDQPEFFACPLNEVSPESRILLGAGTRLMSKNTKAERVSDNQGRRFGPISKSMSVKDYGRQVGAEVDGECDPFFIFGCRHP